MGPAPLRPDWALRFAVEECRRFLAKISAHVIIFPSAQGSIAKVNDLEFAAPVALGFYANIGFFVARKTMLESVTTFHAGRTVLPSHGHDNPTFG